MGDELEKFVMQNRQYFDQEVPSDQVWTRIQRQTRRRDSSVVWKVAAVLFLLSSAYLISARFFADAEQQVANVFSAEFTIAERFYGQMIGEKFAEVAAFRDQHASQEIFEELNRLEKEYESLKDAYAQNASEVLLDAMIQNMQLRMQILNEQLSLLKKLNQQNHENQHVEI